MEQNDIIITETIKRTRGRPKIPDELKKPQKSRQQYFIDYYHDKKLSCFLESEKFTFMILVGTFRPLKSWETLFF